MFSFLRSKRAALVLTLICAPMTSAIAQQLANNWNSDACALTDSASIHLNRPGHLSRIELWYNWRLNETSVQYTVSFRGQQVGTGTLTRGDCDPYQTAWCVAQDTPDTDLQAGTYTFRTAHARVCQNAGSGGRGFVRAYAD